MSKSSSTSSSSSSATTPSPSIKPESYSHSPVHYAVVLGDHTTLTRLLSTLPKLTDPTQIHTESDSLNQEKLADKISSLVDRRDVPYRETPLHLAVRLNDLFAAKSLAAAAADVSLQNYAGWNPLQEALCRRYSEIALVLLRLHHRSAWSKWRRRLPRLTAVLRRMRDFYMEISFHFESSVIPFVNKLAPSDTYKIWKRDANLRADTTLAGFDGLKIQRADQSFLFLGDGDQAHSIPPGSLLVLNHDERKIFDAFESAGAPMSESDIAGFCSQTSVYRPGMDVTKAELISRTNWRRQEKTESVGEWKAKVYELNNVVFSFRSRKVIESDVAGSEQVLPLEFDEDDDGFLVAENPSFLNFEFNNGNDSKRRHSSFVREEREFVSVGRKSVDIYPSSTVTERRRVVTVPEKVKEKEYVKSLKPSVWLTEQFPLKIEELLPLLDILANKVKAVRRMRELLTTKFPAGTFPVKVAIPVVPTVRVVITFTKFVELPPVEQFYTPLSSPRLLGGHGGSRRNSSQSASKQHRHSSSVRGQQQLQSDPFSIPSGYTWTSVDEKSTKLKKSKSTRKFKAASPIWVSPLRPHSKVGISDLGLRRCVDLRCYWDLERLPKWECCCLSVLAQRAITPVEDEKPSAPQVDTSGAIDQVQDTQSRGFHKDLNLLPKPLSATDLSSSPGNGAQVRVAYQGIPGAYSEAAALKAYPKCETVPCDQFEAAFKAVELWLVDKAVLPIENSVGGSIHRNYDLLLRHRLHIVGEVQMVVNHCLLGLPGVSKEELKRVLSHPQALAQCEMNLTKLGIVRVSADDTAGAAQDDDDNITRFLILAREPNIPGSDRPHKTSIVFTLEEGPGMLFKALAVFALRDINLTKIESRPQRKRPLRVVDDSNKGSARYFDYLFYIDFDASMAEPRAQHALAHLQEFARFLRVLGCYPTDATL
ncbi:hypothetical protein SADUNF_Sadunf11G0003300 [Salix dunnii]|uniref:arogenate dehydratase n=1 Tax=Salix dunnii TaxID=1413687 RepID=A0A835JIX5_9ROSI|nr:hypothetical protein SADUNF_Sadunf11G0003300 [Salix dunnii]